MLLAWICNPYHFSYIATSQSKTLQRSIEVSPPQTSMVKSNIRNQGTSLSCPRAQNADNAPFLPRERLHPQLPRCARRPTHPRRHRARELPPNDWVRSAAPIYTQAYPQGNVYHGGKPGGSNFITLDVSVTQGGYSASTKTELIKRATEAIEKYGGLPEGEPRRVYVIIREVAEANLGFDGKSVDFEMLRNPPEGLEPL